MFHELIISSERYEFLSKPGRLQMRATQERLSAVRSMLQTAGKRSCVALICNRPSYFKHS